MNDNKVTPDLEKPDFEKAIDPKGYAIAAAKILDALNEFAMPTIIQIIKSNVRGESDLQKELLELKTETRIISTVQIKQKIEIEELEAENKEARELMKDGIMCFDSNDWEVKILKTRFESFLSKRKAQ